MTPDHIPHRSSTRLWLLCPLSTPPNRAFVNANELHCDVSVKMPCEHIYANTSQKYRAWQKCVYSCEYEKWFILVLLFIVLFICITTCKPTFAHPCIRIDSQAKGYVEGTILCVYFHKPN